MLNLFLLKIANFGLKITSFGPTFARNDRFWFKMVDFYLQ